METIEYSDTADGLSKMSKEEFEKIYLKKLVKCEKVNFFGTILLWIIAVGFLFSTLFFMVYSSLLHSINSPIYFFGVGVVLTVLIVGFIMYCERDLRILRKAAPKAAKEINLKRQAPKIKKAEEKAARRAIRLKEKDYKASVALAKRLGV